METAVLGRCLLKFVLLPPCSEVDGSENGFFPKDIAAIQASCRAWYLLVGPAAVARHALGTRTRRMELRLRGLQHLRKIRVLAAPFVGAVAASLDGTTTQMKLEALEVLAQLEMYAECQISTVAALLDDSNEVIRKSAACTMGRLWGVTEQAVPYIGAMAARLGDENPDVRLAGAEALGQVGVRAAPFGEVLAGKLWNADHSDSDWRVRCAAARALAQFESHAVPHISALVRQLEDSDNDARQAAVESLGALGEHTSASVGLISANFQHSNPAVRQAAAEALGRLASHAGGEVEALALTLDDEHAGVRRAGTHALGQFGQLAEPYAAAIAARTQDSNVHVRRVAVTTLQNIGSLAQNHVDSIAVSLGDTDCRVRKNAIAVLDHLGAHGDQAAAHAASHAISVMSTDGRGDRSNSGGDTLASHVRTARQVASKLNDPDWRVRRSAASELSQLKQHAIPHLPALIAQLQDSDEDARQAAAEAIGSLRQFIPVELGAIAALLRHKDPSVRQAAAQTLGHIGPSAAPQATALCQLLEDQSAAVRRAATLALGELGQCDGQIMIGLHGRLSDPNVHVQRAANKTLAKLRCTEHSETTVPTDRLVEQIELQRSRRASKVVQDADAADQSVEQYRLTPWKAPQQTSSTESTPRPDVRKMDTPGTDAVQARRQLEYTFPLNPSSLSKYAGQTLNKDLKQSDASVKVPAQSFSFNDDDNDRAAANRSSIEISYERITPRLAEEYSITDREELAHKANVQNRSSLVDHYDALSPQDPEEEEDPVPPKDSQEVVDPVPPQALQEAVDSAPPKDDASPPKLRQSGSRVWSVVSTLFGKRGDGGRASGSTDSPSQ